MSLFELATAVGCGGLVAIGIGLALRAFLRQLEDARELLHGCQVFCPGCRVDLTKSIAVCTDVPGELVKYVCECGVTSRWDFDLPVPVFIDSEGGYDE